MVDQRDRVDVVLDAAELGAPARVGMLQRARGSGTSVLSFTYDDGWLATARSFALDPALPLFSGVQHLARLPGIFSDAAPDRWGRTLLERREGITARREQRRPRALDDWDFLLGVDDLTRMGGLRLRAGADSAYLDDRELTVPPRTRLRELEALARQTEAGDGPTAAETRRWLEMLVAPGSSLGGSRPKANFSAPDGSLWIAKFPAVDDRHDVGAWEHVTSLLAARAGIAVPATGALRLGAPDHTFTAQRFDRDHPARRLYASAMTLCGRADGEEASYLDIADAIQRLGAADGIEADLIELFRRLVFNVLTGNRDDHLRNHGFLRGAKGWRLAPAFDVNPTPDKREHALAIDGSSHEPELDAVRDTAAFYRLSSPAASHLVAEVGTAVASWRELAVAAGIGRSEVEFMASAFTEH